MASARISNRARWRARGDGPSGRRSTIGPRRGRTPGSRGARGAGARGVLGGGPRRYQRDRRVGEALVHERHELLLAGRVDVRHFVADGRLDDRKAKSEERSDGVDECVGAIEKRVEARRLGSVDDKRLAIIGSRERAEALRVSSAKPMRKAASGKLFGDELAG